MNPQSSWDVESVTILSFRNGKFVEWKAITFFLHRGSENILMICPGVSTSDDAGYYGVNTGGLCYRFSGGPVPGGKTALQFLPIWYL